MPDYKRAFEILKYYIEDLGSFANVYVLTLDGKEHFIKKDEFECIKECLEELENAKN